MFADVHMLIANYLEEHPEADDKSIRCYVAGDVCIEDLAQLDSYFVLPKKEVRLTTWNRYASEQIWSKKRSFDEMSEISEEYQAMKQSRTEEFVQLEKECEKEKERMREREEERQSPSKRNELKYKNA